MSYRKQDNPFMRALDEQRTAIAAERAAEDAAWDATFAEALVTWDEYRQAVSTSALGAGGRVTVELCQEDGGEPRTLRHARNEVIRVVLVCGSRRWQRHLLVWTMAHKWCTARGHAMGHGRLEDALLAEARGLAKDIDEVRK